MAQAYSNGHCDHRLIEEARQQEKLAQEKAQRDEERRYLAPYAVDVDKVDESSPIMTDGGADFFTCEVCGEEFIALKSNKKKICNKDLNGRMTFPVNKYAPEM